MIVGCVVTFEMADHRTAEFDQDIPQNTPGSWRRDDHVTAHAVETDATPTWRRNCRRHRKDLDQCPRDDKIHQQSISAYISILLTWHPVLFVMFYF